MNRPVPSELLDKYLNGTCTPQESGVVEDWYQSFENNPDLNSAFPESKSDEYSNAVYEKIRSQIKLKEIKSRMLWKLHTENLSVIIDLMSQSIYTTYTVKNRKLCLHNAVFE
jgi:hypothetical protein